MNYTVKNNVIFNDINLSEYGAFSIGCPDLFTKPQRDTQVIDVPGRNGSLLIDNGRYIDVQRNYVVVVPDYRQCLELLNDLGRKQDKWYNLADGWDATSYMQARYINSRLMKFVGDTVLIELQFIRKPQFFLRSGSMQVTMTESGSITNPTDYEALPLIRVYGTGKLTIGSTTIEVLTNSSYIDIDSDTQDAYHWNSSRNSNIRLSSGEFFKFTAGTNNIDFPSTITKIYITPRWWHI